MWVKMCVKNDPVLYLAYLLSIYLFLQHSNSDGISSLVFFLFHFSTFVCAGFFSYFLQLTTSAADWIRTLNLHSYPSKVKQTILFINR